MCWLVSCLVARQGSLGVAAQPVQTNVERMANLIRPWMKNPKVDDCVDCVEFFYAFAFPEFSWTFSIRICEHPLWNSQSCSGLVDSGGTLGQPWFSPHVLCICRWGPLLVKTRMPWLTYRLDLRSWSCDCQGPFTIGWVAGSLVDLPGRSSYIVDQGSRFWPIPTSLFKDASNKCIRQLPWLVALLAVIGFHPGKSGSTSWTLHSLKLSWKWMAWPRG